MKRLALIAVVALILGVVPAPTVLADSPAMPAVGSPVQALTFHISGAYTASKTNLVNVKLPYNVTVLYATAAAQAKSGTHANSWIRLKNAGTEFSHVMDLGGVAAASVVEATLLDSGPDHKIAKDAALTADLEYGGGSSPSLSEITLTIWVQRRN